MILFTGQLQMTRKLYTEQLEKTKESNSSLNVKGMFIFIDHIFFINGSLTMCLLIIAEGTINRENRENYNKLNICCAKTPFPNS